MELSHCVRVHSRNFLWWCHQLIWCHHHGVGGRDFKSQDKRSKGPLEPKWWPKWILIKSQDKRPCKGDGAGGVGLRPQQPPLHGCDLPADRGPHVPGGSRGSTIHGSWGACNSGTRATHARGHRPESHGLVRTGTAGEGLGGEDQAHQTQAGPSRKRPAGEAPVQALRRRRDRFHPHEIPGKRTPGASRTAMEDH